MHGNSGLRSRPFLCTPHAYLLCIPSQRSNSRPTMSRRRSSLVGENRSFGRCGCRFRAAVKSFLLWVLDESPTSRVLLLVTVSCRSRSRVSSICCRLSLRPAAAASVVAAAGCSCSCLVDRCLKCVCVSRLRRVVCLLS